MVSGAARAPASLAGATRHRCRRAGGAPSATAHVQQARPRSAGGPPARSYRPLGRWFVHATVTTPGRRGRSTNSTDAHHILASHRDRPAREPSTLARDSSARCPDPRTLSTAFPGVGGCTRPILPRASSSSEGWSSSGAQRAAAGWSARARRARAARAWRQCPQAGRGAGASRRRRARGDGQSLDYISITREMSRAGQRLFDDFDSALTQRRPRHVGFALDAGSAGLATVESVVEANAAPRQWLAESRR
jgi:hypothetical protein